MEGWIKIHRKLTESELWYKPESWIKIWLYIVMNVSHKETSFLKMGEGLFKYASIAESCNTSYDQVRRCIEFLISSHSLATRKTTRGIFVMVLNYGKYQVTESSKATRKAKQKPNQSQTEATLYNKNVRIKELRSKENVKEKSFTPSQIAHKFFNETYEPFLSELLKAGCPKDLAHNELQKFYDYWTEPNKSGSKERWETEKTFEIGRRLKTWFRNFDKFNPNQNTTYVA